MFHLVPYVTLVFVYEVEFYVTCHYCFLCVRVPLHRDQMWLHTTKMLNNLEKIRLILKDNNFHKNESVKT